MLYFAYGSNMSKARILERVPSARKMDTARLPAHRLAFHKVGMRDGSGKCDIDPANDPASVVIGVVYRIDPQDKVRLDRIEGLGAGYMEVFVTVFLESGETVDAFTYRATKIDKKLTPFSWYKEHVIRGALENNFPEDYITFLRTVESTADPDNARHAREVGIYGPGSPV